MLARRFSIKTCEIVSLSVVFIAGFLQAQPYSGDAKWLRITPLHAYLSEYGAQHEGGSPNFAWPAQYGFVQSTKRSEGLWIGCRDFYAAKIGRSIAKFVVDTGPKPTEHQKYAVYDPVAFKLIGRFDHPIVEVDGELATLNTLYDELDEIDEHLPADRMVLITNHTVMGVTITQRIYAFAQPNHDNYYIYEYILKNTGIIDPDGTRHEQTLEDFWFTRVERYALMGESVPGAEYGRGWGIWNTTWGRNTVNDVIGADPNAPSFSDPTSPFYRLRAHLAWYGPHSEAPVEDDWGCPNYQEDGVMAAAKYAGSVTLHADRSVQDRSDDPYQPRTTHYQDSDADITRRASGVYDERVMGMRYDAMKMGHPPKTHAEEVGDGFADKWGPGIGGTLITQGYGPYTLAPGDSIRIVVAEAVAGISREKNREVGWNWLQWTKGIGTPLLIMPDGTPTTDYNAYKRAWVWTCKDSLIQTFYRAIANFESGYRIPLPPPPPSRFTVQSGGDRIRLTWADNAVSWPHFNGYVIYRAEGSVLDPKTVYRKIFECDASNVVHQYDDTTAVRGFNYYYYIQSKDDGSQNDAQPGKPLYSSLFWTLTNKPAYLRRQAESLLNQVRVVPNPYDIRARLYQFGTTSQYDRIAFYGLPPFCKLKVFTERGDLIWEKLHDNGAGDELWDSMTRSWQIVVSGIYILYVEVDRDVYAEGDVYAWHDVYDEKGKLLYAKGELMFRKGDRIYRKGDSVYRKFVIIR